MKSRNHFKEHCHLNVPPSNHRNRLLFKGAMKMKIKMKMKETLVSEPKKKENEVLCFSCIFCLVLMLIEERHLWLYRLCVMF
ncbi:hypothetical protein L1987_84394 [Smallanthus sonchifolius]|uniref:Uncharacterized protein n=1 Tax=Smallanthus sonchifolius TaxID=185202 RepID=A0ACB8YF75_9ASTR|nr:hypothetical protein L1987_84394 [Smallanthus sonchifolius]